jgi:hypothetical protein
MHENPPRSIEDVARDATWLPHRYDPGYDAIHFLQLSRAQHDALTFLIDSDLPRDAAKLVLERAPSVAAASATAAPLHFIFHSGYCCSTLLARAFDIPGVAMGLREPTIFNDIIGWRRRGGEEARVMAVLQDAMALLAQPFAPGEAVVAKPSNIINGLALPIMAMRPDARAVLLHAPLPVFLGSIARKGMWGALWARQYFQGALQDGAIALGFDRDAFMGQTDLQIAAMGWLAQQALFDTIIREVGADRVRTIDSETLLAHRADALFRLGDLLGLPLDRDRSIAIADGPVFARHSKSATPYDAGDRKREQRDLDARRLDEIDKVAAWTEAVAKGIGIPLHLGAPLLG